MDKQYGVLNDEKDFYPELIRMYEERDLID
jgi:hypothetical protein